MKTMKKSLIGLGFLMIISGTALAGTQDFVIDFEGIGGHGTVVDDEYANLFGAGVGVDISATNNAKSFDYAVAFDSTTPANLTTDDDLLSPFTFSHAQDMDGNILSGYQSGDQNDGVNPGNILIIQENDAGCSDGVCDDPDDEGIRYGTDNATGYFTFDFDIPIFLKSIDFFDIETEEDGRFPRDQITLTTVGGNVISYAPDTGGDNRFAQVAFNVAGVTSMQINLGGSGAIDNIRGSREVPVPFTLALIMLGLAGLVGNRKLQKA